MWPSKSRLYVGCSVHEGLHRRFSAELSRADRCRARVADAFGEVIVPREVIDELNHLRTPAKVREWVSARPTWLRVKSTSSALPVGNLGLGESAAIAITLAESADALLIDERDGTAAARRLGIKTVGTLAVLAMAAEKGLLNLEAAFAALKDTSFRAKPSLLDALLAVDRQRGKHQP